MKVLICDATDPKALQLIEEAGIEVTAKGRISVDTVNGSIKLRKR